MPFPNVARIGIYSVITGQQLIPTQSVRLMQNRSNLDKDAMIFARPPSHHLSFPFLFLTTHSDFGKLTLLRLLGAADIIFPSLSLSLSLSEIASSSLRRDANFASLSYEQSRAHFREVS